MTDDTTDTGSGADLGATLTRALDSHPTPRPRYDLATIKARGRRRRLRHRLGASLGALAVAAAIVAVAGGALPWPGSTTNAASTVSAQTTPDDVVRAYLQARESGDRSQALDYWAPGNDKAVSDGFDVSDITVSAPEPYLTVGTAGKGWAHATSVAAHWTYDSAPNDIVSAGPATRWFILGRNSDEEPWRIISAGTAP